MHASDVVIVGGGVIGLTTAYYLAKDGARVTLLERGGLGQEASWAGAGILPPSDFYTAKTPFDRLRGLSQRLFPGLSEELQETTGIDNGYWICGGIEVTGGEPAALEEEWRGEGVVWQKLSESEARAREPHLAAGVGDAFYLPQLAQLRNPHHLHALEAACRLRGVVFELGAEVVAFESAGSRILAAKTSRGKVSGARFLISAGPWSDELLWDLRHRSGVRPVRGQIALLQPDEPILRHVLMHGARYLVPRRDGRVLVGSTEEDVGFDKRTTPLGIAGLLEMAMRLVPALKNARLERTWAGLRPGSPDGLPFLGKVPGWDNAWLGAGHFRAGIQLSPGSGLLLKEMLLEQPLTMDPAAFGLESRVT